MIEFAVKQEKSFEKIVVLVKSIIQELFFSKMFSFFGASFSRERKSERIERKFKTQNPTFRCNTDCANDPHNCISERLFRQMADLIVSDGYQDVGYSYINVDDCWLAHTRDRQGRLQVIYSQFFY